MNDRTVQDQSVRPAARMRPRFTLGNAIGWLLYPFINLALRRLCRNGTPGYLRPLPNALTFVRAGFPIYGALFAWSAVSGHPAWAAVALAVIFLAYSTDAFDGELARYLGVESTWGQTWDPVFDKVAGVSMLTVWGILMWHFYHTAFLWLLVPALIRVVFDAGLALLAWFEKRHELQPRAHMWGKVKSSVDVLSVMLACGGGLAYAYDGSGAGLMQAGIVCLLIAICLAPLSIWEHWRFIARNL